MDRRQALRRLAAGSATAAVGTSLIVSQPAFAFDNPIVTGAPSLSINTTGGLTATIVVNSIPSGSCPASADPIGPPTEVSFDWVAFWPGANTVMNTGSGTAVSIPGTFSRWFFNDRIRITMVYRYECVYTASTSAICVQWFQEFSANSGGGGATWSLVSSSGPTIVPCPAGFAASSSRAAPSRSGVSGRTEDGTPIP